MELISKAFCGIFTFRVLEVKDTIVRLEHVYLSDIWDRLDVEFPDHCF